MELHYVLIMVHHVGWQFFNQHNNTLNCWSPPPQHTALKPDMFEPPVAEGVELRPKVLRSNSQTSNSSGGSSGGGGRASATISKMQPVLPPHCAKPTVKFVAPPMLPPGTSSHVLVGLRCCVSPSCHIFFIPVDDMWWKSHLSPLNPRAFYRAVFSLYFSNNHLMLAC